MNRQYRTHFVSLFACAIVVSVAAANPYADLAVAAKSREAKALQSEATKAARASGSLSTGQRKAIQAYTVKCCIAPIADPSKFANDGSQLAEYRSNLAYILKVSAGKQNGAHDEVIKQCLSHLIGSKSRKGIAASSKYSAPSRLNAMLLIADLNKRESRGTPVPHSVAGQYMTYVVGSTKQPSYLRIAALNGLRRHAACGALNNKSIGAVLAILKEDATAQMTPEALSWQRRLALETLGLTKDVRLAGKIKPYLLDENATIEVRCAAAEALGRLKYQSNQQADPSVGPVGSLAVAACTQEVNRITEQLEHDPTAGHTAPPSNATRPGEPTPVDPIVQKTRRILLARLNCIETGINGLSKSAAGDNKAVAQSVSAELKQLKDILANSAKTMPPNNLRSEIANVAKNIQRVVPKPK